ncbi:MAG: nucleoside triphosphate pyrophosphohydrolase [Myxococcales bacterium]|nr:nucleoside triphosphate pyrophosphohydrolase [Myxococcales bacterium]MCB9520029.1 nucleoside triphosphate pyrophosphohydrolase [Myxococcales bacterium]
MSTHDRAAPAPLRHQAAPVSLQRFADLVACLRAPDGCPWDRAQTHLTLTPYAVEEVYELVDAVEAGDDAALAEELGDVLLQVVLHSQLASERGAFSLQDVADRITAKMLRRHPHVFGDGVPAADADAVAQSWKAAKRAEGRTTLGGVPRSMPPLERAHRISARAASVGFDFPTGAEALEKVAEEVGELHAAVASGDRDAVVSELGDALFSLVNLARKLDVDPADALRGTLARFEGRFRHIEQELAASGRAPTDAGLDEMDALWDAAKAIERGQRTHAPPDSGPSGSHEA